MHLTTDAPSAPRTKGRVLHAAGAYDLFVSLLLLGKERAFRERLVELGRVTEGESVLDIGCGTGSLAIAAKRRAGPGGTVRGVDPSPEMLARARRKATKSGLEIGFVEGIVEHLPFPDRSFDVVLSTVMFHHLPRSARAACVREARRVLRPGGRFLVVDFGGAPARFGLLQQLHRHGRVPPAEILALLTEEGLTLVAQGPVGFLDLHFALAEAP